MWLDSCRQLVVVRNCKLELHHRRKEVRFRSDCHKKNEVWMASSYLIQEGFLGSEQKEWVIYPPPGSAWWVFFSAGAQKEPWKNLPRGWGMRCYIYNITTLRWNLPPPKVAAGPSRSPWGAFSFQGAKKALIHNDIIQIHAWSAAWLLVHLF